MVKNPPAMQETGVRSLGWEDPLEKGTTIQSSILAWRILAGYSSWGCEESDTTKRLTLSVFRGDLVLSIMLWERGSRVSLVWDTHLSRW